MARPNILLFLTDDQGWDDLSLHGNRYLATPHLDCLARESVQFSNFVVAPVCAATRAALLTGRHFLRTGVAHVHGGKDFVHRDERMLSEIFRAAGYATAMWGKWHCGKTTGYLPWERGFDEAYMARLYKHRDSEGYLNGNFEQHTGWTTETLADYAVDFLERQVNSTGPFFAFVPFLTPHAPLVGDEELTQKYEAMGLSHALATLYAMVEQTDTAVGRVLDALDTTGLSDNTLVLFMSDNGPACNEGAFTNVDQVTRNFSGFKGWKGNMWEYGIKSPLFVRWPGRCEPATVTRLCDVCDIMPTLAELCTIGLGDLPYPLDGRSIVPYLEGDEDALPPKESFLWVSPGWPPDPERGYSIDGVFDEYGPVAPEDKPALIASRQLSGYRGEEWKYMQHPGRVPRQPEPVEDQVLIHIAEDPREDVNVLSERRDVAAELCAKTRAWFEEIKGEPHAFHMPEFVIGDRDPHTFVAAYAPVRIRGELHNTGNGLKNFRTTADAADYSVVVKRAGEYRVSIDYTRGNDRAIALRLTCGDHRLVAPLGSGGFEELGTMYLPEGRRMLRLEVAEADPSDTPIIERVVMLRFEPV